MELTMLFRMYVLASLFMLSTTGFTEQIPFLKLWEGNAPGSKGNEPKDIPGIQVFLPPADKANGTGILICPGGAYRRICSDHEGVKAARWLNSIGIAGFVLRYRLPGDGYKHPIPLGDAQRALKLIRSNAKKWHLDPARIGIMGFSAGGHLAAHAATTWASGDSSSDDIIERESSKPNFHILVYPCVTSDKPYAYGGIFALISHTKYEKKAISVEKLVTEDTPPVFIALAGDDGVNPMNSVLYFEACHAKKVPAELHIYRQGGHGFGLGYDPVKHQGKKLKPTVGATWQFRLRDWLEMSNLL